LVLDLTVALVEVAQGRLSPSAVPLLAGSQERRAVRADIPTILRISAIGCAVLVIRPAIAPIALAVVVLSVVLPVVLPGISSGALQPSVNILNTSRGALIEVLERRPVRVAVAIVTSGFKWIAIGTDVAAGLRVWAAWNAVLPVVLNDGLIEGHGQYGRSQRS
jgi:hypothetical protein